MTIYSSLPLQGPDHARQQQVVNGEKLALSQAGGRVGPFHVSFYSLDDADPTQGSWTPSITSQAAREASQDNSTIAYIGEWDSGATAISLPLINEAGILQISPASPYIGLTQASLPYDDKGEPARYYPSGKLTFGRLEPAQPVQAAAMVRFMRAEGVSRLVALADYEVFDAAIAPMVTTDLGDGLAPIRIDLDGQTQPSAFTATAQNVAAAHPDAVLLACAPGPGALALAQAVRAADPSVKLFLTSSLATPAFVRELGAGAYVLSPPLAWSDYPPAAQAVRGAYRAAFGVDPSTWALYGYEAMSVALASIRGAGRHGNDRAAVVRAFHEIRDRDSVLGRYSVTRGGDVTLRALDGYRVGTGGRLRFLMAL